MFLNFSFFFHFSFLITLYFMIRNTCLKIEEFLKVAHCKCNVAPWCVLEQRHHVKIRKPTSSMRSSNASVLSTLAASKLIIQDLAKRKKKLGREYRVTIFTTFL